MLIEYKFSNFRSFKEMTKLSMVASSQRTLNDNLIRTNNLRILPSCVIYGANASGKSNIIMSLAVMREIVLSGTLDNNIANLKNLEVYPFAYQESKKPIAFEIDFIVDEKRFKFGFEIEVGTFKKEDRNIISEYLIFVNKNNNETKIYERTRTKININKDKKSLELIEFDEKLLEKFENKINDNIDTSELFLSRAFKSIINNEIADLVLKFFREKLMVISDFTLQKTNLRMKINENSSKDFLLWNKILDGFAKNADFGPQGIFFKPNEKEDKDSSSMELVSKYVNKNDESFIFPAELMESRGTLKLLDFAILFQKFFEVGGVFILDEFDAAIHPELIKGILRIFNDSDINKEGSQLVFTTHNPIYLNNRIFRRDQIKFVEKDTDTYESYVYSLADLGAKEVRNDHNFLIQYFKGNYGALPFIDFTKILNVNREDSDNDV